MSKDLPSIPDAVAPDLRRALVRIREEVQGLMGTRGSDGAIRLSQAGTVGGGGGGAPVFLPGDGGSGGGGGTPDPTPPPTPTFADGGVFAGITQVIVVWSGINYPQGRGNKQTIVYAVRRSTSDPTLPTFPGDAGIVAIAPHALTMIAIPSEPNTRWHVWLKFETNDGVQSTSPAGGANGYNVGGVFPTTGQDVSALLEVLTGQIRESHLFSTLGARINLIDDPDTVAGSVAARVKAERDARIIAVDDAISSANAYTGTFAYPNDAGEQVAIDLLSLDTVVRSPTTGLAATRATLLNDYATIAGLTSSLASTTTSLQAYADLAAAGRGALNADPGCQRPAAWELVNGTTLGTTTSSSAVGTGMLQFNATQGLAWTAENIPIDWLRRYRLTARLLAGAGSDRNMYVTVRMFRANGTELTGADTGWGGSYAGYVYGGVPSSAAWTEYGADFGAGTSLAIPNDAAYVRVGVWGRYSAGPGTGDGLQFAQDVRLVDVTDARQAQASAIAYTNSYAYADSDGLALAESVSVLRSRLDNVGGVSLEVNASTTASALNGLSGQYTVKIDNNGYVTGYGLASTTVNGTPTSEFIIRADQFAIAPVNTDNTTDDGSPFFYRTVPTTINGVTVPAGGYLKAAFIHDATITRAKIGDLAVDDAKIAELSAAKLTVGDGTVGGNLKSTSYTPGSGSTAGTGWLIQPNGNVFFNNAILYGTVYASAGVFGGSLSAATGTFAGSLSAATGTFAGNLSAAGGTFAGSLSAATGTFAGALSAAGGTFNGQVRVGSSPTVSGTTMTGTGAVLNASGTAAIGNPTTNITFDGSKLTINGSLIVTDNIVNDQIAAVYYVTALDPVVKSAGSGTWRDAISLTVTSTGRPMVVTMYTEATANEPDWQFMRDSTVLASDFDNLRPTPFHIVEVLPAGTYTYRVQTKGYNDIAVRRSVIHVIEQKTST